MPRRKPTSIKQKKADLKLKRAIKRGDAPPPEPKHISHRKSTRPGRQAPTLRSSQADSVRRLQSAFIALPPKFLEETKLLASTTPLPRPIPDGTAVYADDTSFKADTSNLSCPRRPKWRFEMSKKEVEHNEEGLFKKWLDETDTHLRAWQENTELFQGQGPRLSEQKIFKSPTYFERNLEVWRQLWRVTEISQIILVLLDSRCPLLHYPPSLHNYLSNRKVIFVLTKVDITGPVCVNAWVNYLRTRYAGIQIVQVESYREVKRVVDQGRLRLEPHIPDEFRAKLVEALRIAHTELLEPPEDIKSNELRLKTWEPPVKRSIEWEAVETADGGEKGADDSSVVLNPSAMLGDKEKGDAEDGMQYLTVGLIGK
ncbi:hypothetical protein AX17_000249 [Amanita inopinata Kibby_2008]|nr:hypothetical protein AX17_000249 [Amanita inopinata Kibby_2008]